MNQQPVMQTAITEEMDSLAGVIDDPVIRLLYRGVAQTLHEAEEMYLNSAIPEVLILLGSDLTNEELSNHPLLELFLRHGSRSWEDSIL